MKNPIKIFVTALILAASIQNISAQIDRAANYVFPTDSVAGFDETAASAGALANGCYGREFKVYLYKAKRNFINTKYHIQPVAQRQQTLFQNPVLRPGQPVGGACDNEDFELGSAQGWTIQSGSNSNSCAQPQLNGSALYTVNTAPVIDSRIPFQISSYFESGNSAVPSGSAFIRLNDDQAGSKAVRLSKSFVPTANSALFQYAYLAVIQDGSHDCCDQAGFNIKVVISHTSTPQTTSVLACPNISVAVPGSLCNFTIPPGGPTFTPCVGTQGAGWTYANWTASAIDLAQYINNYNVTINITVVDCIYGGHGAYFYFDSKCSPMSIIGNNNEFPAGTPQILLPTCGAQGATICATPGLGPYSWAGPGVTPNYATQSMTNTCYQASLSATYTLTMNPPGSCAPITKVITTTITPAPLLVASVQQAMCGNTLAVVSATPSGSASNASTINWSPNPFNLNSNNTVASYTLPGAQQVVTITATDPSGCKVVTNATVNPAAPYPTFTLVNSTNSNSITCLTPTLNYNAFNTYTYGTLTYFWASNSQTFNTNPVNITVGGNYTVTILDPATGCSATKVFAVPVNTTAPTSVISPTVQNITCNLTSIQNVTITVTPSVNVSQTIYSPLGGSLTSQSYTMVYPPAKPDTYTHCVVNEVNGCEVCKTFTVTSNQGFPTFSVTSANNFTLGCNSKSLTTITIINASATNSNQVPNGGPVSYTLLPPGASPVTPSGTLSANSTYSVNVPGTWTVITKDNTSLCETRLPISILQNTFTPELSAKVPLQILDCNNTHVTLQGESKTPNVSFNWSFPGTPGNQAGDTILVVTNTVNTTQTLVANYTLTITDNSSTCKSTSVIPIYQSLFKPNAVISGSGAVSCLTPTVILTNVSTSKIPTNLGLPVGQAVIGFQWFGPSPQTPKQNSTTYLAQTPGTYTMIAKDLNNGCTSMTTTIINDNYDYPVVNNPVKPDPAVLDCGASSAKVTPIITSPTAGLVYNWTAPTNATVSNQNSMVLTTNLVGEYQLDVLNPATGCHTKVSMEVVNGKLTGEFEADKLTGFAPMVVNFTNKSSSTLGNTGIASVWNFGNGSSQTFTSVAPTTAVYTQAGSYTVNLYVTKGTCLEKVSKVIIVDFASELTIPNVFTPNNDKVNDVYILKTKNLGNVHMTIFDRWGHMVYELTSADGLIEWDGKNQTGVEQAEGVYFYVITATGKDGVEYDKKGTITLLR